MALQLFDDGQSQTLQPTVMPMVTPASLAARRNIALAMLKEGADYSPIRSPWQGVARVADAIMGGYQAHRLDQQELAGRQAASSAVGDAISRAFGGGTSSNAFPPAPSAAGPTADTSQPANTSVAGGAGGSAPDMSGNDIYSGFMDTIKNGITNPNALAAVAATGKAESSYDPSKAFGSWSDPSQSGQAGTSGGIMSWRGPRFQAMRDYAAANGGDPNAPSPQLQAQFFLQENPSLINSLNAAKTPEQAQQLMNNAWKFAGYDQAGGEAARRIALANNFAQQFSGSPAAAAANAVAGGQLPPTAPIPTPNPGTQVASLDPSIGMPAVGSPVPPEFASKGITQDQWNAMNAPDGAQPAIAAPQAPPVAAPPPAGDGSPVLPPQAPIPQPSPLAGGPNGAAPISPLGQRLLMDPHALSGDGGVLPPMGAAAPSGAAAVAAAMNSPASSAPPSGAPTPTSPGAANVAAAMNGGPSNLPVTAGGSADAISPMGVIGGNGRMGMDPSQISAISSAMANPWMSDGQQQLLGSVLSSRLMPHKLELVDLGNGVKGQMDTITGQIVGTIKGTPNYTPIKDAAGNEYLVNPADPTHPITVDSILGGGQGGAQAGAQPAGGTPVAGGQPSGAQPSQTGQADPYASPFPRTMPLTDDMKAYNGYLAQAKATNTDPSKLQSFQDFSNTTRKASSQTVNFMGETAEAQAAGKSAGDRRASMLAAADAAPGMMSRISLLRNVLQQTKTGPMSGILGQAGALANAIGISDDTLKELHIDPNQAVDNQIAEKMSNKMVSESIGAGKGIPASNFSVAERQFIEKMYPNIANQPGANEAVSDVLMAEQQHALDVADGWSKFKDQAKTEGKTPSFEDFEDSWRQQHGKDNIFAPIIQKFNAGGYSNLGTQAPGNGPQTNGQAGAAAPQPSGAPSAPPPGSPPGARPAPDGNWYVPDPARPGKYLKVVP